MKSAAYDWSHHISSTVVGQSSRFPVRLGPSIQPVCTPPANSPAKRPYLVSPAGESMRTNRDYIPQHFPPYTQFETDRQHTLQTPQPRIVEHHVASQGNIVSQLETYSQKDKQQMHQHQSTDELVMPSEELNNVDVSILLDEVMEVPPLPSSP